MNAKELAEKNKIVKMYAGSIAYGTNLPTSDVDFRGIFCADSINTRTPFFPIKEYEDSSEEDTKYFELGHFMKLTLACNPNVVELLWTDESDIGFTTEAYSHLRSHREQFLSRRVAMTTTGYAMSQLKRIKGHNKWITNPQPEEPPRQTDFVSLVQWFGREKNLKFKLTDYGRGYRLVPYGGNIFGLIVGTEAGSSSFNKDTFSLNTLFEEDRTTIPTPVAIIKFNKDLYDQAKDTHKNYWTWKRERNEVRSELEEKFGYDTKHAMHLVRLLRMGKEVLETGQLLIKRPDAQELLDIRHGSMTYEEILKYAEEMDKHVYELSKTSHLPKNPDLKLAAKVMMEVQDIMWN